MKKNQKLNQKCIAKVVRENICKKHAEKATHVISGCHFESIWNIRSCPGTFFATYFSKLWGGSGWIDFGLPWGTLGLIVLTCWQNLGAILLQMSNIPKWQSQLPKKQRLSQTNTNNQYGQITVYLAGA
jgi:hypothetical protein